MAAKSKQQKEQAAGEAQGAPSHRLKPSSSKNKPSTRKSKGQSRRVEGVPRIFLGSSTESLSVLNIIANAIQDIASVVPWTDQNKFTSVGDYFLESLLKAPGSFDFAVLVLGKDDLVISRNQRLHAPRDNVIFELGLFMGVLGRNRTFIVCPRVWKAKLKILSDLNGLNLSEYESPAHTLDLPTSLQGVITNLREQIQKLHNRPRQNAPAGVTLIWSDIQEHLETTRSYPHTVENLALDMEITWRWLHDQILNNTDCHDITLRVLFLDHRSAQLAKYSSESVSVKTARMKEQHIVKYVQRHRAQLLERNITFSLRAYSSVPVLHGFLINNALLFLSACKIDGGKLVASQNPYMVLAKPVVQQRDLVSSHFHSVFRSWFKHLWSTARIVCNS